MFGAKAPGFGSREFFSFPFFAWSVKSMYPSMSQRKTVVWKIKVPGSPASGGVRRECEVVFLFPVA